MLKKRFSLSPSRSNTTFVPDDDVDDETFLKVTSKQRASLSVPSSSGKFGGSNSSVNETSTGKVLYNQRYDNLEDQKTQILNRKLDIEQRTLESTSRSLSLLRDSEEVGTATAEELDRQREQLETTNDRLDDINESLHYSGKHIQGISSIFGSIKNYWSNRKSSVDKEKEKLKEVLPSKSSRSISLDATPKSRRQLQNALDRANTNVDAEEHPAFRMRGISSSSQNKSSTDSNDVENMLDRNLEEMSLSISRLKGLAEGLGQELDSQNNLLDDISVKTEKADISIERQRKDIARILRKK